MTFDVAIIEQGLELTAIGVATAFALLIALSVGIGVAGRFFGPQGRLPQGEGAASAEARERALAAAVAVSVLRAARDNSAALPGAASSDERHSPQSAIG